MSDRSWDTWPFYSALNDHVKALASSVEYLADQNRQLEDRLAAAESKIGRLLRATEPEPVQVWPQYQAPEYTCGQIPEDSDGEPPRGPYRVHGCVGGTEHDWHTVEHGATFWCPECDAERPARA